MNKVVIFLISLNIFIFQGCCFLYQPEEVDKIVKPFNNEIYIFYSENRRYPDNYELNDIINKIKWKKINVSNDYDCNGYKCHISTLYADLKSVELQIKYNKTLCNYYFDNIKIEKQCYKEPCFSFKQ